MVNKTLQEPFLFEYISSRTHGEEIGGSYNEHTQMWMVENGGHTLPLIEADQKLAEISTKTDTVTEADDQKIWSFSETATKTLTQTEKDDQIQSSASLVEIGTTTKVITEADDISRVMNNMFL